PPWPCQLQHAQLLFSMYADRQAESIYNVYIFWIEKTFQQQYRTLPACVTTSLSLLQIEHGKAISTGEARQPLGKPMPIGTCFHDRPYFRCRTAPHLRLFLQAGDYVLEIVLHGRD